MTTYLACMGTRPEIIKMAPIYRTLKAGGDNVQVLHTGQHEDMAQALYQFFEMDPDYQIQLKRQQPTLSNLTAELLQGIGVVAQTGLVQRHGHETVKADPAARLRDGLVDAWGQFRRGIEVRRRHAVIVAEGVQGLTGRPVRIHGLPDNWWFA